jgi:hypothetical protein
MDFGALLESLNVSGCAPLQVLQDFGEIPGSEAQVFDVVASELALN